MVPIGKISVKFLFFGNISVPFRYHFCKISVLAIFVSFRNNIRRLSGCGLNLFFYVFFVHQNMPTNSSLWSKRNSYNSINYCTKVIQINLIKYHVHELNLVKHKYKYKKSYVYNYIYKHVVEPSKVLLCCKFIKTRLVVVQKTFLEY